MRAELPKEFLAVPGGTTVTGIYINTSYICDCCLDKEAFPYPYRVKDRQGIFWQDLCNDCFEVLGCVCDIGEMDEVE